MAKIPCFTQTTDFIGPVQTGPITELAWLSLNDMPSRLGKQTQQFYYRRSKCTESKRKKIVVLITSAEEQNRSSKAIKFKRYGSLAKPLIVTASVFRFIEDLKFENEGKDLIYGRVSVSEIENHHNHPLLLSRDGRGCT